MSNLDLINIFTGYYDKNGKPLYLGDFIEVGNKFATPYAGILNMNGMYLMLETPNIDASFSYILYCKYEVRKIR